MPSNQRANQLHSDDSWSPLHSPENFKQKLLASKLGMVNLSRGVFLGSSRVFQVTCTTRAQSEFSAILTAI